MSRVLKFLSETVKFSPRVRHTLRWDETSEEVTPRAGLETPAEAHCTHELQGLLVAFCCRALTDPVKYNLSSLQQR